nr:ABC transporter permease [uncultured Gellertiella sp.]
MLALPAGLRDVLSSLLRQRSGQIGVTLLVLHLAVMLIAPLVVPYDFSLQDGASMFGGPSAAHWLGTDHLGRDVFTRLLLGGRQALFTTFLAAVLAVGWGAVTGISAGYVGGWYDELLMRVIDAFQAVPWLLFVMLLVTILGNSTTVMVLVLGFCYGLPSARIARSATLDIVASDYISAARLSGDSTATIIFHEILPNVRNVILVDGAMQWSWMLLWFSSLSFLGLGVSPPNPDWGLMISEVRLYMQVIPLAALAPMLALSSLIIGINLTADTLGKAFGIDRAKLEAERG